MQAENLGQAVLKCLGNISPYRCQFMEVQENTNFNCRLFSASS